MRPSRYAFIEFTSCNERKRNEKLGST